MQKNLEKNLKNLEKMLSCFCVVFPFSVVADARVCREKTVESIVESLASQPGVIGVVVSDKHGLALAATASVRSAGAAAGFVSALVTRASELSDDELAPTIAIETDAKTVFVQQKEDLVLAVFRLQT
jgi:predicted regulator of Ras-like GTPase activity (Roadblock/LC7/MglB family)